MLGGGLVLGRQRSWCVVGFAALALANVAICLDRAGMRMGVLDGGSANATCRAESDPSSLAFFYRMDERKVRVGEKRVRGILGPISPRRFAEEDRSRGRVL